MTERLWKKPKHAQDLTDTLKNSVLFLGGVREEKDAK